MNTNSYPNKGFTDSVPPETPPSTVNDRVGDGVAGKNISLSVSSTEGNEVDGDTSPITSTESITNNNNNNNQHIEREKTINSVIDFEPMTYTPPKRRYRKNAVRDRCRLFAQDLEAEGFQIGNKLRKSEVRYWIIALDLAHDKTTVKQYLERLVIYSYFFLHRNGMYEFCGSVPPGQLTLLDPTKARARIEASLYTDRRIKRRSY